MLHLIVILILVAAGIGFDSINLLPCVVREQVSNLETFRWLIVGFISIIGLASGLVAQTTYRRLENRISSTSIEVILTRAVELVIGLLIANLLLVPIFLLPISRQLLFIKPMVSM
ncbi:MAG: PIN/TRAM domain-containing protein, partial [cyanobacterium endosymbiont of Rhopalodia yunnanensis]